MTDNTRIYNRFTGYTTEDCSCEYCLYKGGKERPCLLDECCCMEERQAASQREQAATRGFTARTEAVSCRV